jgi:hypothetical protein
MQLVKTVNDIEIYVNSDGRFIADVGGKKMKRVSIKPIEKAIMMLQQAVTVHLIRGTSWDNGKTRREIDIVAFEKSGKARDSSGELLERYGKFYIGTQDQIEAVDELIDRQKELNHEWGALLKEMQNVHGRNFETLRDSMTLSQPANR